ncbi:MAG: nucleotidyl transferase AbiEii/AbiGii toxin family protein [Actinomycetota bacterium]|nr:nucleotidyl transferase AbiEii/AbiGii toxin family protein [Actinomycetota bacterium]
MERLLDLLAEFGSHPSLKGKLALHGGTAINLFMLDIPRLSVDIDVSYVGAIGREEMLADRPVVERFADRQREYEGQLLPMLRQGQEPPSLDALVADARAFVGDCVEPKDDAEREYLERFAVGDFQPSLLFPDESMAAAALVSPEAQWKLRNLKLME